MELSISTNGRKKSAGESIRLCEGAASVVLDTSEVETLSEDSLAGVGTRLPPIAIYGMGSLKGGAWIV